MAAAPRAKSIEPVELAIIFALAFAIFRLAAGEATPFDVLIAQADSFLHGHLYLIQTAIPWEHITVNGFNYSIHPPLAALLCTPFVALGFRDQGVIFVLFGAISVMLAYRLTASLWLTAFYGLGTVIFYEVTNGASWGGCLLVSTIPTFLALIELGGKRRPCVVGLCATLAAFARWDLALVIPVYLAML